MKKKLVTILALTLAVGSLTACDSLQKLPFFNQEETPSPTPDENGEGTNQGENQGENQGGNQGNNQGSSAGNQGSSNNVGEEGTGPAGWEWKGDYGWIEGVWDSDVLPENFPKEIEGVKVDDMWYYGYGAERSSKTIGHMDFATYDYEEWELSFFATDDQLAAFEKALADNGFLGTKEDDQLMGLHGICTDSEIYLYYSIDESEDADYPWEIWCDMTVFDCKYPKYFESLELPQFGLFTTEDANDRIIYAYDEEYNDVEFTYDFEKGQAVDGLPAYLLMEFYYSGVSRADYDAYITKLRGENYAGWEEREYGEGFLVTFRYQDYYCAVDYECNGDDYVVWFKIACDWESLYY